MVWETLGCELERLVSKKSSGKGIEAHVEDLCRDLPGLSTEVKRVKENHFRVGPSRQSSVEEQTGPLAFACSWASSSCVCEDTSVCLAGCSGQLPVAFVKSLTENRDSVSDILPCSGLSILHNRGISPRQPVSAL